MIIFEAPAPRNFVYNNESDVHEVSEPETRRRRHLAGEPAPPVMHRAYGEYRIKSGTHESTPACETNSQTAAADPDPGRWNAWFAANFAAARQQETQFTEFERDVIARTVTYLQREADAKIKEMQEQMEAMFAARLAGIATDLRLSTAELGIEVAGLKSELCGRLDRALADMRKVLGAIRKRREWPMSELKGACGGCGEGFDTAPRAPVLTDEAAAR